MKKLKELFDFMKKPGRRGNGNRLAAAVMAAALGFTAAAVWSTPVMAVNEGIYLVTVRPSYKNPVTGAIDDPGNNEAIGQGMTERMCGSTGLLEVDGSGRMHLTVRYYLSQFIKNVSFEEGAGNSFSSLSYEEMQSREAVEGATNLEEKYGYTDYRLPISSVDSVFRGKAYIEPMGRDVVYFFTFSNPIPGSGDFKVISSQETQTKASEIQSPKLQNSKEETVSEGTFFESLSEEGKSRTDEALGDGSGQADDPVTGIPSKPIGAALSGESSAPGRGQSEGLEEAFGLDTGYDLSAVPIEEARKLAAPMLKNAEGITGGVSVEVVRAGAISAEVKAGGSNSRRTAMLVSLLASSLLLLWFPLSALKRKRRSETAPERSQEPMEENGRG